ncbi:MAG: formate dehydrogenase subunit gamma [Pseudomonadota bacterium]|nr:formate dehydrogenase subunit gamma [Pseudomonadota bacterium]
MAPKAEFDSEDVAAIVEDLKGLEGPLLPILHAVQDRFGHVPDEAVRVIAHGLNLTRAEVYGVVSFYHDYHREPHGAHTLKVCRAEACQAAGGDVIADRIEKALGIKFGETTADGRVTLEAVYCLGLCATAPSAMLDDRLFGRLNAAKADRLTVEAQL